MPAGAESLAPLIQPAQESFFDYLPDNTLVLVEELEEGAATQAPANDAENEAETAAAPAEDDSEKDVRCVAEIMTPRPIAVEEDTPIEELCNLMWNLKIHRIPIVSNGRVRGIISTIDICRLVVEGRARLTPVD